MRQRLLKSAVVSLFAVLASCLWYMQCIQTPRYEELSHRNRIRLVPLPGPRGDIYDRKGGLIAGNRLAFDCAVIPQEFKADKEKIKKLSAILQVQSDALEKRIKKSTITPFAPAVLKKDIGQEAAIAISERSIDFPGLIIQTSPNRYYPEGRANSHVAGYLGKISENELEALRDYGYKMIDFVGRAGLEFAYDDYLRGEDGGVQTEVDSMGRELQVLGIKEPKKGKDITLTTDLELQAHITSLLSEEKGAVIVMMPDTGEVLAAVSKPDFDPNLFVGPQSPGFVNGLLERKDYPLVNRAISGAYPAGSVFKIVTASAGLELKKIRADEVLNCPGFYTLGNRRFNCWKKSGHGLQTIAEGIQNSCNVFFYQAGRRAGVDGLAEYASLYGFGAQSGVDLPFEAKGVVPTKAWKRRDRKEAWYEGDTVNYAIGQGYLLVTPIQILQMVSAVATEGELARPFLVKKIDNIEVGGQKKKQLGISKGTFRLIKEGMEKAVEDPGGTAKRAGAPGLKVAGKTGTAETGTGLTHAWFAGFSPVEKPRVSLVVFLEYGGKGGDKPSRIASGIFEKLKDMGYL